MFFLSLSEQLRIPWGLMQLWRAFRIGLLGGSRRVMKLVQSSLELAYPCLILEKVHQSPWLISDHRL